MSDQPPRKRRWFSFSLRAFLAGVFLIAIALGVLTHRWHRYQHQKATIASLGHVEYYRDSRLQWWRYLLTNEQLADDVRRVGAYGSLNERDLKSLRMFRRLEKLWLRSDSISDITPLAGLTQLKTLYLLGTDVTDISALSKMTQLEELYILLTPISDITPLAGLTQLKLLYLYKTEVTDISALSKMTQLEMMNI